MNKPLLVLMDDNRPLFEAMLSGLNYEACELEWRQFPDGETCLNVLSDCKGRDVVVQCTLSDPDTKLLRLYFLVENLREMGARRIGLVAPYLAYMRQDDRFSPGEAVTSRYVARMLSNCFDWLVTVDPHLHRFHALNELYQLEAVALSACHAIAPWMAKKVANPVLIGPDEESEQWVKAVAELSGAPYLVLAKERYGDRDVNVGLDDTAEQKSRLTDYRDYTPVLIDDIVSTGSTILQAARLLQENDCKPAVCIVIHPLFAGRAMQALQEGYVDTVISCNTIRHESNQIDLTESIVTAVRDMAVR